MSKSVSSTYAKLLTRLRSGASWAVAGIGRKMGRSNGSEHPGPQLEKFDANAFRSRVRFRDNYKVISKALLDLLSFETVLDLGCANGFLLEDFVIGKKDVKGIELSPEVRDVLPVGLQEKVSIADAVSLGRIGQFDLVCCVEVAEHIQPESSCELIDTIVSNASRWIYFTAASPCQPGHGHINCRQQFFWLNEFHKRGAQLDWDRTEQFLTAINGLKPAEWLVWNSLILRVDR